MPAPVCKGIATQLTLFNQPLVAAFILILLVTYLRPSELLGIEKEGSCPTAGAASSLLVGRDRSFRNWSVYQDRGPRWGRVLVDQRWLQWVSKLLPQLKAGDPEERIWTIDDPAAAKMCNNTGIVSLG